MDRGGRSGEGGAATTHTGRVHPPRHDLTQYHTHEDGKGAPRWESHAPRTLVKVGEGKGVDPGDCALCGPLGSGRAGVERGKREGGACEEKLWQGGQRVGGLEEQGAVDAQEASDAPLPPSAAGALLAPMDTEEGARRAAAKAQMRLRVLDVGSPNTR